MPVPKTNLFKGDRVKLSPKAYTPLTKMKSKVRVGTIISDTLNPNADHILVHWDGCAQWNRSDKYQPDELVLFEEEFELENA